MILPRLNEIFSQGRDWEEYIDYRVGGQNADVVIRFKLGDQQKTIICEVKSIGQPRHMREAIFRLQSFRNSITDFYPLAISTYIGPNSAEILKKNGIGYLDLSGNCYLSFDNIFIEKEGKPNIFPSKRPLKSLFSKKASRVVRILLAEPDRPWRFDELARMAGFSIGHAYNVAKSLIDMDFAEKDAKNRVAVKNPGRLLDEWAEQYTYKINPVTIYYSSEVDINNLILDISRFGKEANEKCVFTMHAGAHLIAPHVRFGSVHFYYQGNREELARNLGLTLAEFAGNVHIMTPYDDGIFHSLIQKDIIWIVPLPQLYVDLYHYEGRGQEQAAYLRKKAIKY